MNKKQHILVTAKEVMTKKGYHHTTIKDISDAMHMKRTTFYDYFKSKDQILYELIEQIFINDPVEKTNGSFEERLLNLALHMLERTKKYLELYRLLFSAMPSLDETFSIKIGKWQKPFIDELQVILNTIPQDDHDIQSYMFAFRALIGQKMSDYIYSNQTMHTKDDALFITNFFIGGVSHGKTIHQPSA